MIIQKGKYNTARIMLPEEQIWDEEDQKYEYKFLDKATREQIQGFLNHPACKGETIVIMPDAHAGKGSCVGFTFPLNNYIIPNMVGVDIGCGIYSYKLGEIHLDSAVLQSLDKYIHETIPSGFSVHAGRPEGETRTLMERFNDSLYHFVRDSSVFMGQVSGLTRFYESMGTLGGGNHFIELGIDGNREAWLTVHSGSRNYGLQVANYYQNKAKSLAKTFFLPEDQYKGSEFLPMDLGGKDYLRDMDIAQRYARVNRMLMLQKIVEGWFHQTLDNEKIWASVHNYIDFGDNIIRKGAISAYEGERVVIPFNMEDGLILGYGKGNPDWNFSAPHGAGRILSRSHAKKVLSLAEAKSGMEKAGIFTTSLSEETLDEAKGAYKPKELILEMIKDTVDVVSFVKPVYNFKAK